MAHFVLKVFNTLAFILFFSSSAYNVAFPSKHHQTFLSAAPFAFSVWGLIHLLFLGFVVYQWLPFFEGKDEVVGEAYSWNFVTIGLLTAIWLQLWKTDYLILAWIVTLFIASSVGWVYYKLSFFNNYGLLENLFARAPISLFTGWISYIVWLTFAAAFTTNLAEHPGQDPTIWDRAVVYAFYFTSIPGAVLFNKSSGYGDPLANFAVLWAILGITTLQTDVWIRYVGYFSGGLILLACFEPLFRGRSTASRDIESAGATADERTPLVA